MKIKNLAILAMGILLPIFQVWAQTSPFLIPPKWMFGYQAGFNFGRYQTGITTPPTLLTGNPSNSGNAPALEGSSAICDTSGALAIYSNSVVIYNGFTNALVRNMNTTDNLAANSATDGSILVPDPASAPKYDKFYLFLGNDNSAGLHQSQGIVYYKLTINPVTTAVTITAGPTTLTGTAGTTTVDESLTAGTDGAGGYWLVSHDGSAGGASQFWVWHITSTGIGAVSKLSTASWASGTVQGTVKISPCQNKIAWTGNNSLLVYNWDMTTGTLGSEIYKNISGMGATGSEPVYGIEFSPDGSKIYHTVLGSGNTTNGTLSQIDLNTSTMVTIASGSVNGGSKELGTMQLGPDNKIYVTNGANVTTGAIYVGVISSPNTAATGGTQALRAASVGYTGSGVLIKPANAANDPSAYRGIDNLAWMSPQKAEIDTTKTGNCKRKHSIDFKTYFNTQITPDNTTIQWSFNGGAYTAAGSTDANGSVNPYEHTYGTSASTVDLKFKDKACGYSWTAHLDINSCTLPITLVNFAGEKNNDNKVVLTWTTSQEINNNYFEVLRSDDGVNFSRVGRVSGSGNTLGLRNYTLVDDEPIEGISYYKLVQYDYDGTHTSSNVITIDINAIQVSVFPNPTEDGFTFKNYGSNESVLVLVSDVLGNEVYRNVIKGNSSSFTFGQNFIPGVYILTYITDQNSKSIKLEKK